MGIFRRSRKHKRNLGARLDELQSDLSALRREAGKLVEDVSGAAIGALDAAEAAYGDAGKWTAGNISSMRSSVRSQPLAACLVSLGAGAVLGALLLRPR